MERAYLSKPFVRCRLWIHLDCQGGSRCSLGWEMRWNLERLQFEPPEDFAARHTSPCNLLHVRRAHCRRVEHNCRNRGLFLGRRLPIKTSSEGLNGFLLLLYCFRRFELSV